MLTKSKYSIGHWLLLNFFIVACIGVIMRYKIGFDFPYMDQKNLQHAHSHFAFIGWVSQSFLMLFFNYLKVEHKHTLTTWIDRLLWMNLMVAYALLISFAFSGYSVYSIALSTINLLLFFIIAFRAYRHLSEIKENDAVNWFKAAFLFGLISYIGTIYLCIMMATKSFDQHYYLSSVYWYLHFQYNGYFFFMIVGLLVAYIGKMGVTLPRKIFVLLFISTFFTYGLSVLWLDLPVIIYLVIVVATLAQSVGFIQMINSFYKQHFIQRLPTPLLQYLFLFISIALSIKFLLQAGSIVPSISQFAFGFRSIVIAYLHLVLLAVVSMSIICFLLLHQYIAETKSNKNAIILLTIGIFLNELVLSIQGIGSIGYILIPYANEVLFIISGIILLALFWLIIAQQRNKIEN